MNDIIQQISHYIAQIDLWEFLGLVFGLLAVYYLIKENLLTWPTGIIYCFISFYIFWNQKLYQDFVLTGFFLVMNIYGWYFWTVGKSKNSKTLLITQTQPLTLFILLIISIFYIFISGYFVGHYTDASLPYWDATTTGLSFIAMWLTARKKIENWLIWLIVDILATGIYFYKGIYFYSALYCVYIVLAILGWVNWKKLMAEGK